MYPQDIRASLGVKMLCSIFEQFVQESPVSVMARGLMERVFAPERMDKLFETHAKVQQSARITIFQPSRFDEFGGVWNSKIGSCRL
jgi:hypothetical protein